MKRSSKNKKNKLKVIILILVLVAVVGLVGYYLYDKHQKDIEANRLKVTLKEELTAEINSEITLGSFVESIVNGEVLNGEEAVNTTELGEQELTLNLKNKDDEEEKYPFKIKIIDTEAPTIEAKKEITSYVSKDVNLLEGVKVTDNSKEEITAKVVGEYDKNKVGNYKLKLEATDSSGNTGEYDFTLNIISDPNNRVFTTSKGYSAKVVDGITYVDGVLIANKTYSLPSSYAPGLLSQTKEAFNKLKNDASALGYDFYIGSGYRSYWDQKVIYNNYVSWDGQANADTYSARPGHSEHQSGLAFDICDHNVAACITSAFDSTEQAKWLNDNCYKYGLIIRYPQGKTSQTGYIYESWHLRYVGVDLATKVYNGGDWITLEAYYGIDSKYS